MCIRKNVELKNIEMPSLSDFTIITVTLAVLAIFFVIFSRVAQVDPQDLNKFPNYLFVYWVSLANEPVMSVVLLTLVYTRNEQMRKIMSRELRDFLGLQNFITTI